MASEEDDVRSRWAQQEMTQFQRTAVIVEVNQAQRNLHAQCSATSDPKVAAAYAHFLAMSAAVKFFEAKK